MNKVIIVNACDSGNDFRFSYRVEGVEEPDAISFSLQGKGWSGGVSGVKLSGRAGEIKIPYNEVDRHKKYFSITHYTVTYKGASFSRCDVRLNQDVVICK